MNRRQFIAALMALSVTVNGMSLQGAFASSGYKFYGTVQSLPAGLIGTWIVDGRTVNVTSWTRIKQKRGVAAVGAYVEVEGNLLPSGAVDAYEIEVKSGSGGGAPIAPQVKFYGTVQSLPAGLIGTWTVDGRTVNVTPGTRIKQKRGPAAVGAYVEVKGTQQPSGAVDAYEIEVKSGSGGGGAPVGSQVKFYGTVQSLPAGLIGTWMVDGRTVNVTPGTQIKQKRGPAAVGAFVEVKGVMQTDGSVNAFKIEVK